MLKEYPVGMPIHIVISLPITYFGMIKARVTVDKEIQWPFLMYNDPDKGLIQPVGSWVGWFTSEELIYAIG